VWSLQTRRAVLQFDGSANAVLGHLSSKAGSNVSHKQQQQLTKLSSSNPTSSTNAVLSLHWLSPTHLLTQSKIGVLTIWQIDWDAKPTTVVQPLHTILTQQYTFARCTVSTQYQLIATSGEIASNVTLYHYPSLQCLGVVECEKRETQQVEEVTEDEEPLHDAGAGLERKFGMVMCMALLTNVQQPTVFNEQQQPSHAELRQHVYILVGTESGHLQLHRFPRSASSKPAPLETTLVALLHLHAQPTLNLDVKQSLDEPHKWIAVTGGASNNVAVCSITLPPSDAAATSKPSMRVINNVTQPHSGVNDLAIRADLKIYAAACWDHRVRVYGIADHSLLAVLQHHAEHVYSVAWCPTLQRTTQASAGGEQSFELGLLASGGKDNKVAVWQLYNDQQSTSAIPTKLQASSLFLPASRAAMRQQQATLTR